MTQEEIRMSEAGTRKKHWQRWGPYLSERAWGTVREDYSAYGSAWEYLPHDHARSRAYRWGEDGIGGFSDDRQRLCISLALWNGADPFLKEQLRPDLLEAACAKAGIPLNLRLQSGYDHSYYFVSTFMADHLRWHAARLQA